ncbi:unnamed protein product [Blepharisma stoltei]|uniref:Uncharacterized protein n=1 Tax=Blepharisma stoltei TaxID=1481888 RepID=A0AAU9IT36_9CILI|nr:unnamed protein product [Blepharisma stoltei]
MKEIKSLFLALLKKDSSKSNQSLTEEDTKSTTNPQTSISRVFDSEIDDSFFGSISEGNESVLVQKIPRRSSQPASAIPLTHSNSMNEALWQAALQNKAELCRELLQKSFYGDAVADVNFKGDNNDTSLHVAAQEGFLRVCEILLDYGERTDIDAKNSQGRTALHIACMNGYLQLAQLLVRSGAEIDVTDNDGNTPLHLASQNSHNGLLIWLLSKKPSLFIENNQDKTAAEVAGSEETDKIFQKYINKSGSQTPSSGSRVETQRVSILYMSTAEEPQNPEKVSPFDFELLQELGKGSFGEVYLVRKTATQNLYAMKVLRKDRIMAQNLIKYALTERNVMSYVKHPFIVSLNYAFQTPEKLFLILDYCPGGDLGLMLTKEKRFSEEKAKIYLAEVTLALEELHKKGIIFRDLKPDNVVIDEEGHALLTDFGLSKEGVHDNYVTKSFCGSLAYLAPEMIRRQGHGKSVDWYLLGVLLYEMLVGIPPYFSANREELISNIQKGKLRLPSSLSTEAKCLIKNLLQRDPNIRLGARKDAEEIKSHEFFRGIDWQSALRRELRPPIPERKELKQENIDPIKVYGDLSIGEQGNAISGWSFVSC